MNEKEEEEEKNDVCFIMAFFCVRVLTRREVCRVK